MKRTSLMSRHLEELLESNAKLISSLFQLFSDRHDSRSDHQFDSSFLSRESNRHDLTDESKSKDEES